MFEAKKKAVVKKKSVTPVRKVAVTKTIPTPSYSYEIDEDYSDDASAIVRFKGSSFSFSLSSAETPFCCGLREFGEFRTSTYGKHITADMRNELINETLRLFIEVNRGRTAVFTLIKNTTCNYIREAVADGELFTMVKSFTNPNGGRVNNLYVSNS